jgi:hypothetical protein
MQVSLIAVLVAAIVMFIIGALWYGALFGRQWRALQGVAEGSQMTGMGVTLAGGFVVNLIMAYVLARLVVHYGTPSLGEGVLTGLLAWVGFGATITANQILYERRPWLLWAINNGYLLIGLVVMGAILGWWHAVPAPAPGSV